MSYLERSQWVRQDGVRLIKKRDARDLGLEGTLTERAKDRIGWRVM